VLDAALPGLDHALGRQRHWNMTDDAQSPGTPFPDDGGVGFGAEVGLDLEEIDARRRQGLDSCLHIRTRGDVAECRRVCARPVQERSRCEDPRAQEITRLHPIAERDHSIERSSHVAHADDTVREKHREHDPFGELGLWPDGQMNVHVPETRNEEPAAAVDDRGSGRHRRVGSHERVDPPVADDDRTRSRR
jgi:hypothetical protein